jgi:hypothetical protein
MSRNDIRAVGTALYEAANVLLPNSGIASQIKRRHSAG